MVKFEKAGVSLVRASMIPIQALHSRYAPAVISMPDANVGTACDDDDGLSTVVWHFTSRIVMKSLRERYV